MSLGNDDLFIIRGCRWSRQSVSPGRGSRQGSRVKDVTTTAAFMFLIHTLSLSKGWLGSSCSRAPVEAHQEQRSWQRGTCGEHSVSMALESPKRSGCEFYFLILMLHKMIYSLFCIFCSCSLKHVHFFHLYRVTQTRANKLPYCMISQRWWKSHPTCRTSKAISRHRHSFPFK